MITLPLVDLKAQHREIAREVEEGFARVCENTSFILGQEVAEFEREYASYCGARHVIGVANGTDALELALRALGLGPGDEVLVPTNTFVASALAVHRAGVAVRLTDCDEYGLLDLAAAEKRVTPRTRAIMAVHLFGQCAAMEAIADFARQRDLAVIEDAAQAQGAKRNGRHAGTFGRIAGTSFYPGKNLGAYGDAGAVITNDDALASKIRALRNYGSEVKYFHPEPGFNSRLDSLQAVVLRAKLKRLDVWNGARRVAAKRYGELLTGLRGVELPKTSPGNEHIWHIFAVRVTDRDRVLAALHSDGIGAGIHYPVPIHLQGAFASLGHKKGDFPVAERAAAEMISLPLFPEITPTQQESVAAALRRALR